MRPASTSSCRTTPRQRRARGVRRTEDAQVIALVQVDPVLRVDRARLGRAVLPEPVCPAERERGERLLAGLSRRGDPHDARLVEGAVRAFDLIATLRHAQLEERAADDRRVALAGVVRPLEHADAPDDLGDDEVDVGIALPVDVQRKVDRDVADLHLDAGPAVEVEASEVDVVAQALAVLVVDEETRGRREHLARLLVRGCRQRLAVDAHVAQSARRRPAYAADLHDLGRRRGYGARRGRARAGHRRARGHGRRAPRRRVQHDDVLDARAHGATVARRRREPARPLHGVDGRPHEGTSPASRGNRETSTADSTRPCASTTSCSVTCVSRHASPAG